MRAQSGETGSVEKERNNHPPRAGQKYQKLGGRHMSGGLLVISSGRGAGT